MFRNETLSFGNDLSERQPDVNWVSIVSCQAPNTHARAPTLKTNQNKGTESSTPLQYSIAPNVHISHPQLVIGGRNFGTAPSHRGPGGCQTGSDADADTDAAAPSSELQQQHIAVEVESATSPGRGNQARLSDQDKDPSRENLIADIPLVSDSEYDELVARLRREGRAGVGEIITGEAAGESEMRDIRAALCLLLLDRQNARILHAAR